MQETGKPILMIDPLSEGKRHLISMNPNLKSIVYGHTSMQTLIKESQETGTPLLIEKVRFDFNPETITEYLKPTKKPNNLYFSTLLENLVLTPKILESFTILSYCKPLDTQEFK